MSRDGGEYAWPCAATDCCDCGIAAVVLRLLVAAIVVVLRLCCYCGLLLSWVCCCCIVGMLLLWVVVAGAIINCYCCYVIAVWWFFFCGSFATFLRLYYWFTYRVLTVVGVTGFFAQKQTNETGFIYPTSRLTVPALRDVAFVVGLL
ncbi:hypothetical protein ES703_110483 [subsurface metagenome]